MVAPLDAEYSVIGSLLLEPQIAGELFAATSEQDFTREELRNVYLAARQIFNAGKPLDAVTLRAAVGKEYEPLFAFVQPKEKCWYHPDRPTLEILCCCDAGADPSDPPARSGGPAGSDSDQR